jgi:hypothetical protein
MLDPCFKSLWIVQIYVGGGNAIHFAIRYDVKEVIPLLMIVLEQLNPIVKAQIVPLTDGFGFEDKQE